MKILAAILALLATALVAVKVMMVQRTSGAAEAMSAYASEWGSLEWGSTFADFTGAAGLQSVIFTTLDGEEIRFDTATLFTNVPAILGLSETLGETLPPVTLRAELNSEQWLDWSSMLPWLSPGVVNVSGNPFETLACGGVTAFSTVDVTRMGYPEISSRVTASYSHESSTGRLDVAIEFMTRRVSTVRVDVFAQVDDLEQAIRDRALSAVSVDRIRITLDDQEFNGRRNRLCDGRRGRFAEPFLLGHSDALSDRLKLDDPTALGLYGRFATGGVALELDWRTEQPVPLSRLLSEEGAQALDQEFKQTMTLESGPSLPLEGLASAIAGDGSGIAIAGAVSLDELQGLEDLSLDSLGEEVGSSVFVVTRTGQSHRGVLVAVEDGHVMIEVRALDVLSMLPLSLNEIERIARVREPTSPTPNQ